MTDLQQFLRDLAVVVAADLGQAATVSVSEPTLTFRTAVVRIRPIREAAAPVNLWAENDYIAAYAGTRAQFLLEDESEGELLGKARSLVREVAEGRLIDKYLGRRYITSTLGDAPKTKVSRLVCWPPYSVV